MFSVNFLTDLIIILKKIYIIKITPKKDKIDMRAVMVKVSLKKVCICSRFILIV